MRLVEVLASILALLLKGYLAKSEKGSFQHGSSIIEVDQRKTACWYQIFWSDVVEKEEILHRKLPPLLLWKLHRLKYLNNWVEIFIGGRVNVTVLACHVQRLPKESFKISKKLSEWITVEDISEKLCSDECLCVQLFTRTCNSRVVKRFAPSEFLQNAILYNEKCRSAGC